MTAKELIEAAEVELKLTTVGYKKWAATTYKDVKATHWWKAMDFLAQAKAALEPAPPPPPPPPATELLPRYGIAPGYHFLTLSASEKRAELGKAVSIGAKWFRFDAGTLTVADDAVNACIEKGVIPVVVLHGTTGPITAGADASFCTQMAQKYAGKVRVFEYCNEPDLHSWTASGYGSAYEAARKALVQGNPNAVLLFGALWKCSAQGGPGKFVQDALAAGAKPDAVSMHLYDPVDWASSSNVWWMTFGPNTPNVRGVLDAHGYTGLPIIATEAGATVTQVSEATQANRITLQMQQVRAASHPTLQAMAIYSLRDDDVVGFGMQRPDGSDRPAVASYKAVAV